jgi:hypothetical protein
VAGGAIDPVVFAVLVGITALQRVVFAWHALSGHGSSDGRAGEAGRAPGG